MSHPHQWDYSRYFVAVEVRVPSIVMRIHRNKENIPKVESYSSPLNT